MAEVATIAGLVTFGAQTVQAVVEAKRLVSAIKNAPEDVEELLEEVSHTQELLITLNKQHEALATQADLSPIWKESLRRCQDATTVLNHTATELKQRIGRSNLRGSIKALLNKDVIKKLRNRLENAKYDLLLAQSCFDSALQLQQLTQHLKISEMLGLIAHNTLVAADRRGRPQSPDLFQLANVVDDTGESTKRGSQTGNDQKVVEFTLGYKWMRRLFAIRLNMAPCTFGFQIMQQNIVHWHAPIIMAAYNHDYQTVIELFRTRQASIYDTDEYGCHPIEVRRMPD